MNRLRKLLGVSFWSYDAEGRRSWIGRATLWAKVKYVIGVLLGREGGY
jgi:hypothetical protein